MESVKKKVPAARCIIVIIIIIIIISLCVEERCFRFKRSNKYNWAHTNRNRDPEVFIYFEIINKFRVSLCRKKDQSID